MNTSKSLFCIILLFTLWECKKESELAPIVVIPKKYDINLIFDNKSGSVTSGITTVIAGESVMVTISPNTGYLISSVKINGIEQVVSKSYELKDVKSNIEIRVEFVLDSGHLFITSLNWSLKNADTQSDKNSPWEPYIFEERAYTDYWVFDVGGTMVKKFANGITFGGPYQWVLTETTLTIAGQKYTVDTLNKDELVIISLVKGYTEDGKPIECWLRETFYHKPVPVN